MNWNKDIPIVLEELDKSGEKHSCIMASVVLLDVLRNKGIKGAYPLTVKPRVFNPKATERLNNQQIPTTQDEIAQWQADGCGIIVIGHGAGSAKEWPAHLVVIIPHAIKEKDALCDLTITQANHPDWGIKLGPVFFGVRDEYVKGNQDFGVVINGCRILYRAFPDDNSFKDTPLWKPSLKREMIVKKILKRLSTESLK